MNMAACMPCPGFAAKSLWVTTVFFILFTLCDSYTEVFSIITDDDGARYYAGNIDSNFFMAKRSSGCSFEWTSSAGSATGDDDNDENREIFYGSVVGSDGFIYAAGTTKGNFSSPEDEVPTLDAAVLVYDTSDGSLVRQAQYDVDNGLDDVAGAVAQKPDGTILVAVYGSPPNAQNTAVYSTKVLEISPDSLELVRSHDVQVQTSGTFASITGGPTILHMVYVESQEAVVAVGQILGRGLLFMFSLSTGTIVTQTEWGSIIGNMQIGGLATDDNGAFFVTGSSSENILENADLQNVVTSELHAYVIRYDNLLLAEPEVTWVRQLVGSGSSQSGDDVSIDPSTGAVVVIGSFHADFVVTDEQNGSTYELSTITTDGLTDIFVWYLDAESGSFTDLRRSFASTASEDRGNVVEVSSSGQLEIGGVINDGTDDSALACDEQIVSPSPSPSPRVSSSMSVGPSSNPVQFASPSPTSSVIASDPSEIIATQQPFGFEVTPSLVPTQAIVSPSSAVGLVSGAPSVSPSMTASPNPSDTNVLTSATPNVRASTRPSVTSSGGPEIFSTTPSVSVSRGPSASLVVSLGSISATPSVSTSVGASISPLGSAGPLTAPSMSSPGVPSASAAMVLLISSTPTPSPSESTRELVAPSDVIEMVSDAPSTSLSFSGIPSASSVTPSISLGAIFQSPSASKLPILSASATAVFLISSSPTPSPSASRMDIVAPSDETEIISEAPSPRTSFASSASPSDGTEASSPAPNVEISPRPSVSLSGGLGSISATLTPSLAESTGVSMSPLGSPGGLPLLPNASQPAVPAASVTMVFFVSTTPTLSPSASVRDLEAPSDTAELISDAPVSSATISSSRSTLDETDLPSLPSPLLSMDISASPSVSSADTFGNVLASPSVRLEMNASRSPSGSSEGTLTDPSASQLGVPNASATMVLFLSSTPTPSPLASNTTGVTPSGITEMMSEAPIVSTSVPEASLTTSASISESLDTNNPTPSTSRVPMPGASATPSRSPTPSERDVMPFDTTETSSGAPSTAVSFSEMPLPSSASQLDFSLTIIPTPSISSSALVMLISTTPTPSPSKNERDANAPSQRIETTSEALDTAIPFMVSPSIAEGSDAFSVVSDMEVLASPSTSLSDLSESLSGTQSVIASIGTAMSPSTSSEGEPNTPNVSRGPIPSPSATMVLLIPSASTPAPFPSKRDLVTPSDMMEEISEAPSTTLFFSQTPFLSSGIPSDSLDASTITPSANTLVSPRVSATAVVLISPSPAPSPLPSGIDATAPSNAMDIVSEAPNNGTATPYLFSVSPADEMDVSPPVRSVDISIGPSVNFSDSKESTSGSPFPSRADLVTPLDMVERSSEAPSTTLLFSEMPSTSFTSPSNSLDISAFTPIASQLPIVVTPSTMVPTASSTPTFSPLSSKRDFVAPSNGMDMTSDALPTTVLPIESGLISSANVMDVLDTDSPAPSERELPTPVASSTMIPMIFLTQTLSPLLSKGDLVVPSIGMEMTSEALLTTVLPIESDLIPSANVMDVLDTDSPAPSERELPTLVASSTMIPMIFPTPTLSPLSSKGDLVVPSIGMEMTSEALPTTVLSTESAFISSANLMDVFDTDSPAPSAREVPTPIASSTMIPMIFPTPTLSPLSSKGDLVVPSIGMEKTSEALLTTVLPIESGLISSANLMDVFDTDSPAPSAREVPTPIASSTMIPMIFPTPTLSPLLSKEDLVVPSSGMEMTSEVLPTAVLPTESAFISPANLMDVFDTDSPAPSAREVPTPIASSTMIPMIFPTQSLSPLSSKGDLVVPSTGMEMTSEALLTTVLPIESDLISSANLMDVLDTDSPAPSASELPTPFASSTMIPMISPTPTLSPLSNKRDLVVPSNGMEFMSEAPSTTILPYETPFVSSANLMDSFDTSSPAPSVSRMPVPGVSPTIVPSASSSPALSPSRSKTDVAAPSEDAETIPDMATSIFGTPVSSEMPIALISFSPVSSSEPSGSPASTTTNTSSTSDASFDTLATESQLPTITTLPAQSSSLLSELPVSPAPTPPSPTSASDSEDTPEVTLSLAPTATPSRTRPLFSISNVSAELSFSPSHRTLSPSVIPATPVVSVLVTPFAATASSEEVILNDMQSSFSSLTMNPPRVTETTELKTKNSPEPGELNPEKPLVILSSDAPEMMTTLRPMETSPSVASDTSFPEASPTVTPRATDFPISSLATQSVTPSAAPGSSAQGPNLGSTTPLSVSAIPPTSSISPSLGSTPLSSFISATPLASALVTPFAPNPSNVEAPGDMQSSTTSFSVDPLFTEMLERGETGSPQMDELNPEDSRITTPFDSDVTPTKTSSATSDVTSPETSQAVAPRPSELFTPSSSGIGPDLGSTSPSGTTIQISLLVSPLPPTPSASPFPGTITSGPISTTTPASVMVTPLPTIESSVTPDVPASTPRNGERGEVTASLSASPIASLPEATPVSVLLLFSPTVTPEVIWPEASVTVTVSPLNVLPTQTFAFTEEPTPPVVGSVILWTPSPDPTVPEPCSNLPSVVPDSSLLAQTENFQRVRLSIQVAGPNMTNTCHLSDEIVQRFVNLSAMSTLSSAHLWFITSIEDGPAVLADGSTLVVVEEEVGAIESTSPQHSASPEDVEELFPGSIVFGVTAFLNPFSVELVEAAYLDYVRSQNIVRALRRSGHDEIHWTGIVSEPVVVDKRRAPAVEVSSGVSGGYIAGIAFGTLLIVGAAVFIVAEAGRPV